MIVILEYQKDKHTTLNINFLSVDCIREIQVDSGEYIQIHDTDTDINHSIPKNKVRKIEVLNEQPV